MVAGEGAPGAGLSLKYINNVVNKIETLKLPIHQLGFGTFKGVRADFVSELGREENRQKRTVKKQTMNGLDKRRV